MWKHYCPAEKVETATEEGALCNWCAAAAAAGGVPVNGIYRNGSVLMVRVV